MMSSRWAGAVVTIALLAAFGVLTEAQAPRRPPAKGAGAKAPASSRLR